jgi:ATPase family associated with various cellular activities (AAA)
LTADGGWPEANDRYLGAALHWLRLLLEWHTAGQSASAAPAPVTQPAAEALPPRRVRLRRRPPGEPDPPRRARLALPRGGDLASEVADASRDMRSAAVSEPPPALVTLGRQLGLSPFEHEVLLLCAGLELDPYIGELCGRAQGDRQLTHPTFALALSMFPDPTWDALSPHRGLRYWRLIEIGQASGQPLTTSPLRVDERILNYVKGLNEIDDRLDALLSPLEAAPSELPPTQAALVEEIAQEWRLPAGAASPPVIQLLGPDGPSKQAVAAAAAAQVGRSVYRVHADLLPSDPVEIETLARLWHREGLLLDVALYIDAQESDRSGEASPGLPLNRFLARSNGVFFVATRDPLRSLDRSSFAVDVARPTQAEQRAAWQRGLGPEATEVAAQLAAQFDLNAGAIEQVVVTAAPGGGDAGDIHQRAWRACVSATRLRLDALAQRIDPKATWDDFVLPEQELRLLRQIPDQYRNRSRVYEDWGFALKMSRGFGISALFAGPSGTGKTMAAEVIANDLMLGLYRIDLSAVVSKYIGETEKNLRRVFDAAEEGPAVLFFDEADALFGKRSEVRDSHDRYANIEINYLLQRMEGYRGLAILATNMKSALDSAFMRRLRFIINFPFPELAQRRAIWGRAFPTEIPTEHLDFERLARLPATGGMVHNIAINAAFAAASRNEGLTMPLVLDAARAEFRKLELPIPESDFAWSEEPGVIA